MRKQTKVGVALLRPLLRFIKIRDTLHMVQVRWQYKFHFKFVLDFLLLFLGHGRLIDDLKPHSQTLGNIIPHANQNGLDNIANQLKPNNSEYGEDNK